MGWSFKCPSTTLKRLWRRADCEETIFLPHWPILARFADGDPAGAASRHHRRLDRQTTIRRRIIPRPSRTLMPSVKTNKRTSSRRFPLQSRVSCLRTERLFGGRENHHRGLLPSRYGQGRVRGQYFPHPASTLRTDRLGVPVAKEPWVATSEIVATFPRKARSCVFRRSKAPRA